MQCGALQRARGRHLRSAHPVRVHVRLLHVEEARGPAAARRRGRVARAGAHGRAEVSDVRLHVGWGRDTAGHAADAGDRTLHSHAA